MEIAECFGEALVLWLAGGVAFQEFSARICTIVEARTD